MSIYDVYRTMVVDGQKKEEWLGDFEAPNTTVAYHMAAKHNGYASLAHMQNKEPGVYIAEERRN